MYSAALERKCEGESEAAILSQETNRVTRGNNKKVEKLRFFRRGMMEERGGKLIRQKTAGFRKVRPTAPAFSEISNFGHQHDNG